MKTFSDNSAAPQTVIVHADERFERVYINMPVNLRIVQEEGSAVKIHVVDWQAGEACVDAEKVYRIAVEQQGACRTELYGLADVHGDGRVTIETHVHHAKGGGTSEQLIKFVLRDRAQGRFVGDLRIQPDAQQVEAHQTNRNLVLSDDAMMRTQPQLEIYADDVQATHGASTGQLDESALFYMQQRGIDVQQARTMLVNAFMVDVIEKISDDALRKKMLQHLVDPIDGIVE